ncbi:uncharacterized protein LOC112052716 [Bicyclus anynana]|uniref:Uncharacterized protein LOC112052716 n=1 Tax=Bicyclus anynana TaxID=110368 RepID=A0A6J1NL52_BICAN|nr:uncharacterized protein LOC112052716 [Bicyclus anynana]
MEYKSLNLKRASIKGRVTKFTNQLDDLKGYKLTPTEINVLNQRLAKIEALFVEFDGVQNQIECLDEDNLSSELDTREAIEQTFHTSIAAAQMIISEHTTSKKLSASFNVSHSSAIADEDDHEVIGFRLPVIKINNFDGTYYKWLEFRDTFSSLIHNNSRIKNVHKFHYLNSYLEGEAARVISNIEVTDNNYPDAWNLLCERYSNVRQLINNHIKMLFNIEQARESDKSLRFIVDHVTKNLRALSTLKQPTEHWDSLIIYLVSAKLDNNTRFKWEEFIQNNVSYSEMPTLEIFLNFLKGRADVLESVFRSKQDSSKVNKPAPNSSHTSSNNNKPHNSTRSFIAEKGNVSTTTMSYRCAVCSDSHRIYECPKFLSKSVDEKIKMVAKLKLCTNCLRGHSLRNCRLPGTCRNCRERHNTMLCQSNKPEINKSDSEPVAMSATTSSETLLCTALVDVINPKTNKTITTKALLDSGSQCTFITQNLKEQLNLITLPSSTHNVLGIGNIPLKLGAERCEIRLQSKLSAFNSILSCLVIPKIAGKIPKSFIDTTHLNLKSYELADPSFFEPAEIGLLLGADVFWDLILFKQHSLGKGNPILRQSKLGWLIAGPMHYPHDINKKTFQCHYANVANNNELNSCLVDLHSDLKRFWELESLPQKPLLTDTEKDCEQHFLKHTTRSNDGRFCVKLPLTDNPERLGDSYHMAKKRFLNLERRFCKQPELKNAYVDFINEYANLGHLSVSQVDRPEGGYFIPHHPVLRDSESTRLRVVYDASARTGIYNMSINDIQMIPANRTNATKFLETLELGVHL